MAQFDTSQLASLTADLRDAAPRAVAAAKVAVAKTAFDLSAIAQTLAPVDTGFLRSSIGTDVDGLTAVIGPTAEYGAHVEFGTYRMQPQPYMGPAADQVEPGFAEAMRMIGVEAISR